MTKQDVANKCKDVASSIKGVLEATDALQELCRIKPVTHTKEEGTDVCYCILVLSSIPQSK